MQQLRRELELLSQTDLPILLHGESGTGKSFVAELLHRQTRTPGKFVRVDCLSQADIASVLFNAVEPEDLKGEPAQFGEEGGTLLLDGIEELSLSNQGVLLLLLKREAPLGGGNGPRVRIVSTTSVDLQELTEQKRFRLDLLYHINAVKLDLRPLRQRPEDIRGLVEFYMDRYSREAHRPRPHISQEALELLQSYPWPGNVRQLDNLMRSFVDLGSEEVITRELVASRSQAKSNWNLDSIDLTKPVALKEITRQITHDVERQIILKVLQANGWNRQKTAKWLQISYRSLLYKLNDLSEDRPSRVQSLLAHKLRVANY